MEVEDIMTAAFSRVLGKLRELWPDFLPALRILLTLHHYRLVQPADEIESIL